MPRSPDRSEVTRANTRAFGSLRDGHGSCGHRDGACARTDRDRVGPDDSGALRDREREGAFDPSVKADLQTSM